MLAVTADTNVYVSALNFGGAPLRFLHLARSGAFRLSISPPIEIEVRRVLGNKFNWRERQLDELREQLVDFAQRVTPTQTLSVIEEEETDNRIIECAVAADSDYIVSGDHDLLRLQQYGSIRILKVADFLDLACRLLGPQR